MSTVLVLGFQTSNCHRESTTKRILYKDYVDVGTEVWKKNHYIALQLFYYKKAK